MISMRRLTFHKTIGGNKIEWWGYLHKNNSIIVKRWFGDLKDYTDDCEDNDFVVRVVPPFEAASREQATEIIVKALSSKTCSRLVP